MYCTLGLLYEEAVEAEAWSSGSRRRCSNFRVEGHWLCSATDKDLSLNSEDRVILHESLSESSSVL